VLNRQLTLDTLSFYVAAHGVSRVVLLDHMDCCAFEHFMKKTAVVATADQFAEAEKNYHMQTLRTAAHAIKSQFKHLEVLLFIYNLSGLIEPVQDFAPITPE
jgi:carbonic anhydrase